MLVEHFFFTLVPAGVLLLIGRRIKVSEAEQAAQRAFVFLLGMLLLVLAAAFLLENQPCCPEPQYFLVLSATALIPIVLLQWSRVRSRQMTMLLLAGGALGTLFTLRYALSSPGYGFMPATMLAGGLLTLLLWQAGQARGRWRLLAMIFLCLLVGLVLIQQFAPNSLITGWPQWLQPVPLIAAYMLWPGILPILVGLIVLDFIRPGPQQRRRRAVGLGILLLLLVLTAVVFREVWLFDMANDNLGGAFFMMFPPLGAGIFALLLIWNGRWRALLNYGGVLLAAMLLLNLLLWPALLNTSPADVVANRAALIDSAIDAYHQDNGTYPDDLLALIPRYMLSLPNPILFKEQTWCYEAGADYYRFGYVHRPAFGVPNIYITIETVGEAGDLPDETWACDAQLAAYHEQYAMIGTPGS